MANLKAAGYDSSSLSLDDELYPAYVQIASSLWSRQNLVTPIREDAISRVENAPAAQLVATLKPPLPQFLLNSLLNCSEFQWKKLQIILHTLL